MPQKATVDKLLAESFKALVAVEPIEKITIKEITEYEDPFLYCSKKCDILNTFKVKNILDNMRCYIKREVLTNEEILC